MTDERLKVLLYNALQELAEEMWEKERALEDLGMKNCEYDELIKHFDCPINWYKYDDTEIGTCECCGIRIYENDVYAKIDGKYYCDYCGGENGLTLSEMKEQENSNNE